MEIIGGLFGLVITVLVFLLHFGPAIWALIDLFNGSLTGLTKVVWVLVILFAPCVGPLLYFFLGRTPRRA